VHAEHQAGLLEGAEDAVHRRRGRAAGHAREDEVRVLPARVDRPDERHAEAEPRDAFELTAGELGALERQPAGWEQAIGGGAAEVARPVVVRTREGIGGIDVLDEGEVGDHHRGDDHHLVDAHEVHVAQPRVGIVGATVLDVAALLAGERRLLEPPHHLLVHLRAGDADRIVPGEVVGAATDGDGAAVQHRLPVILPVRLPDQLAVRGVDVLRPDGVRVVDVRIAIEDREGLGHESLTVVVVHGVPPSMT
jgi:hypothetical protein